MAKKETKKDSASAVLDEITSLGYMVFIGGAGKVRTSPVLPADLHERFTNFSDEIKTIIIGGGS